MLTPDIEGQIMAEYLPKKSLILITDQYEEKSSSTDMLLKEPDTSLPKRLEEPRLTQADYSSGESVSKVLKRRTLDSLSSSKHPPKKFLW